MLDTESAVVRALERGAVGLERDAIGAVADRMRVDLESVCDRIPRDALDVRLLQNQQPRVLPIV